MLRAVSTIFTESQALELLRRDVFKLFRTHSFSTAPQAQTVLTSRADAAAAGEGAAPPPAERGDEGPGRGGEGPAGGGQGPRRGAWGAAAAAVAAASLGAVYYYRKSVTDEIEQTVASEGAEGAGGAEGAEGAVEPPTPRAAGLPAHVQYLLVGAGTASFAAMRAIRSARPDAAVLLVGEERALPYMRPPLSKEVWREPDLAAAASALDSLTFRQWNGRRRGVLYEPAAFYAPAERLAAGGGGAAVARGWRVERLDVARHAAELRAAGEPPATITYDRCLVATGVRARRLPALRPLAAAGRSLALRDAADLRRLAAALERPDVRRVAVVGGGFLACELSAALAERLSGSGATVTQVFRERAPMAGVLPGYLAAEAARRLRRAGVRLVPAAEVEGVEGAEDVEAAGGAALRLAGGGALRADLVVECVGAEPDERLARASGLETDPARGGLVVNAELQARADVWAAGDCACFYDAALGRRRVEHHDHAVVSGRLAGQNMAAAAPPAPYTHQSMFWSDLGPDLGYEAIGIIDSELPTVGVFSADAVSEVSAVSRAAAVGATTEGGVAPDEGGIAPEEGGIAPAEGTVVPSASDIAPREERGALTEWSESAREGGEWEEGGEQEAGERQHYSRGVVFYLRERRVVGVLLWNLFNRMHVARQVLAQGEFDDLFEVAKLFSLHEEE